MGRLLQCGCVAQPAVLACFVSALPHRITLSPRVCTCMWMLLYGTARVCAHAVVHAVHACICVPHAQTPLLLPSQTCLYLSHTLPCSTFPRIAFSLPQASPAVFFTQIRYGHALMHDQLCYSSLLIPPSPPSNSPALPRVGAQCSTPTPMCMHVTTHVWPLWRRSGHKSPRLGWLGMRPLYAAVRAVHVAAAPHPHHGAQILFCEPAAVSVLTGFCLTCCPAPSIWLFSAHCRFWWLFNVAKVRPMDEQ